MRRRIDKIGHKGRLRRLERLPHATRLAFMYLCNIYDKIKGLDWSRALESYSQANSVRLVKFDASDNDKIGKVMDMPRLVRNITLHLVLYHFVSSHF